MGRQFITGTTNIMVNLDNIRLLDDTGVPAEIPCNRGRTGKLHTHTEAEVENSGP